MKRNFVTLPPSGLLLALQYWDGDEVQAMRLARLLANIEPEFRDDVTLAFCRRFDTKPSQLLRDTMMHCGFKFPVMELLSERRGEGHPDGCNELAAGVMDILSRAWSAGNLSRASVFLMEADGVPVKADWIDRLQAEHGLALCAGKRITGTSTGHNIPHVNGSLVAHLSLWIDRQSLWRTPSGHAWDLFHAPVLMQECRTTSLIANVYGAKKLSRETMEAFQISAAWLANVKDSSAIEWAERKLVALALAATDKVIAR